MVSADASLPQQLFDRLTGPTLLDVLNVKSKPAPEVLQQRVVALRTEIGRLLATVPDTDPTKSLVLDRLAEIQRIVDDPLEWHILVRASAMRLDPKDVDVRKRLEASFLETHVPRAVWLNAPTAVDNAESRRAVRLPLMADVDVEVTGGQVIPLRTENLSRTGLCLCEMPPTFQPTTVKLHIQLPGEGRKLVLAGHVAWRRADRAGISFKNATAADEIALDKALQGHFAAVHALAERYLVLSPADPTALACASMARFYSTVLPNERAAARARLIALADEHPQAFELQLANARLSLDAADLKTATVALRRAEKLGKGDPRYVQLDEALGRRGGRARRLVRAIQGGSALVKAAAAGVVFTAFAFSAGIAALALRGPYEGVDIPEDALPCSETKVANGHVVCSIDVNAWNAIGEADRPARLRRLLSALAARDARTVDVRSVSDGAFLFLFSLDDPELPADP